MVDIGSSAPVSVVSAAEVSVVQAVWRVLRAGGEARHHPRLAAEIVRIATTSGASSLTIAPGAPAAACRLLAALGPKVTKVDGRVTFEL